MSTTNTSPPLTPAVFHILLALSSGERHGYGIMKQVEADSQRNVSMGAGTLYGSLKRMLDAGLVEESDKRVDPKLDDERRIYYRITGIGRKGPCNGTGTLQADCYHRPRAETVSKDHIGMNQQRMIALLYKKLLNVYPREFRERFNASMAQTFNDLYQEKQTEGKWFSFVPWLFIETAIPSFPLVAGEIELGVSAVNEAGNESEITKFMVSIDFIAPEPPKNLRLEDLQDNP